MSIRTIHSFVLAAALAAVACNTGPDQGEAASADSPQALNVIGVAGDCLDPIGREECIDKTKYSSVSCTPSSNTKCHKVCAKQELPQTAEAEETWVENYCHSYHCEGETKTRIISNMCAAYGTCLIDCAQNPPP